jgi:quercetin dioxygenase-like cupin family protein
MADVTVKRTEDFEPTFRGGMLKARAGLGVTSFGMQLLRFPPDATRYPEHDHAADGQEEVYTVLEGVATLAAGGDEHRLEPGVFARVGPSETRKLLTGEQGALVLVLGGVPGAAFSSKQFTEEGEPDPLGTAGVPDG